MGQLRRALRRLYRRLVKPRKLAFIAGNWSHGESFSQRRYESYESYLDHQKAKLATRKDMLEENRPKMMRRFQERFRTCRELRPGSNVLCLGARIGTEVEAFIGLGHFAVGIDLNPGADNAYVVTGDFHRLVFADGSVDVVYSNCLDHLYDLDLAAREIARVLRPGGIAIIDIVKGYEEGFTAGEYEAAHWATAEGFADSLAKASGLPRSSFRHLAEIGHDSWYQLVLVKPQEGAAVATREEARTA
jgi:SAM-dependent methyltransferase